jgi:hypothetical protein
VTLPIQNTRGKAETEGMENATWIGHGSEPAFGTRGTCGPTNGYADPESAEKGAYWFQPEGEEDTAYYCDPERDLAIEHALEVPSHV